ncbi:MAG: hypothetical protein GY853_12935 [PVC group bacterium]|nr:hypothetical protein [PVC group bacterium]
MKKNKKQFFMFISSIIILSFIIIASFCVAQPIVGEQSEVAGEFFEMPVSASNYYFAKRVIQTFGAKWRGNPKIPEELEDLVWQELLFSYEAFKRGIEVTEEEIDEEIEKTIKAQKVEFNWRTDKDEFQKWVEETLKVPVEMFRHQMEHLIKIEILRTEIIDSIEPEVTEEESYQKFLNEYNTLLVELVQFDDMEKAKDFYEQSVKPLAKTDWEKLVWDEKVLSYEATKRGIEVLDEEVEAAIEKIMVWDEKRVQWKTDSEAFKTWIMERTGETEDDFRKHIKLFVKIEKLLRAIKAEEEPAISDNEYKAMIDKHGTIKEAYAKFIAEYEIPLGDVLHFGSLEQAIAYYEKLGRTPGFWEDKKREDPKSFKRPGFVALDFLVNMWGFQVEDAYKMLEWELNAFYPPAPIYKGFGVFKILRVRRADPAQYKDREEYYLDRVSRIKKHEGFKDWVKTFTESAKIKRFIP